VKRTAEEQKPFGEARIAARNEKTNQKRAARRCQEDF
jgi:hypothetical protein